MDAKTAKALAELGRAAARLAGVPDDVVITMTVCPDREDLFNSTDSPDSPDSPDSAPDEDFFYAQHFA